MTTFRDWRERHNLSQTAAGALLGYTRRWIGQLDRGEAPIPPVVSLAMRGYEATQRAPVASATLAPKSLASSINLLDDGEIVAEGDLTPLAKHVASLEGWGLFWNEAEERLEIERDDTRAIFADDKAAYRHVFTKARAGSKLHRLALELHEGD